MPLDQRAIIVDIDAALSEWNEIRAKSDHDDCSDQAPETRVRVSMLLAATVDRVAPRGSSYRVAASRAIGEAANAPGIAMRQLPGVLHALRADYAADKIRGVEELIHAETFGDFLEMASHLQAEGYKDAAAVISGSTLEAHLRALCTKHPGIALLNAQGEPRKASSLNEDLAKVPAYSKGDQKSITAWLDLRNNAAHGHYDKYEGGQVGLLIEGLRDFIRRVPA
jgi:hypothetical protein